MEEQNICQTQNDIEVVDVFPPPRNLTSSCSVSSEQTVVVKVEEDEKALRRKVAKLEVDLKEVVGLYKFVQDSNKELRSEIVDLKTTKSGELSEIEKIRQELDTVNKQNAMLKEKNNKLVNELASSKTQQQKVTQKYKELKEDHAIFKGDFISAYYPFLKMFQKHATKADAEKVGENLKAGGQRESLNNSAYVASNNQENSKCKTTPNDEVLKPGKRPNTRAQDNKKRKTQNYQQEECPNEKPDEELNPNREADVEGPPPKKNGRGKKCPGETVKQNDFQTGQKSCEQD